MLDQAWLNCKRDVSFWDDVWNEYQKSCQISSTHTFRRKNLQEKLLKLKRLTFFLNANLITNFCKSQLQVFIALNFFVLSLINSCEMITENFRKTIFSKFFVYKEILPLRYSTFPSRTFFVLQRGSNMPVSKSNKFLLIKMTYLCFF